MGAPRHFPICRNFCCIFCVTILWYFYVGLLVVEGFILFPLHMTMVWYLTKGAGIPAPSDAIDVVNMADTRVSDLCV